MKDGFFRVQAISPEIRVSDVSSNTAKIIRAIWNASENGANAVSFPELSLCGYTCADLILSDTLLRACENAIDGIRIATEGKSIIAFVGAPLRNGSSIYDCGVEAGENIRSLPNG